MIGWAVGYVLGAGNTGEGARGYKQHMLSLVEATKQSGLLPHTPPKHACASGWFPVRLSSAEPSPCCPDQAFSTAGDIPVLLNQSHSCNDAVSRGHVAGRTGCLPSWGSRIWGWHSQCAGHRVLQSPSEPWISKPRSSLMNRFPVLLLLGEA